MTNALKSKIAKAGLGLIAAASMLIGAATVSAEIVSAKALKVGSRGAAVVELQKALGLTPADGIFGKMTKAAVVSYQSAHSLTADGVAGKLTIKSLNEGGTQGGTTPPPVSGAVTASLAATNPVGDVYATGTAQNPMLAFNIANGGSASVSITGLKLTKTGYFNNTDISGISVYDGAGVRHGNVVTTLGANSVAVMTCNYDRV